MEYSKYSAKAAAEAGERRKLNPRLRALEWKLDHPKLYRALQTAARKKMRLKRPFGINQLREQLRRGEITGNTVRFTNTMSPYIARFLINDIPGIAPFIKCRPTRW